MGQRLVHLLLLIPFLCFGAVQVTKQYCDNNAGKAMTNAVNQIELVLPSLVDKAVTNYMVEASIPTYVTNYEVRVQDNVISNFYHETFYTNYETIAITTNYYHYTAETNDYYNFVTNYFYVYTTTNHYEFTTNYDTFVTSVEHETNTTFILDIDGLLKIEQNGELIWQEKETISIPATNETLNTIQNIEPYIQDGNILWRVKQ